MIRTDHARPVGADNRPLQVRNHRLLLAPGDVRQE